MQVATTTQGEEADTHHGLSPKALLEYFQCPFTHHAFRMRLGEDQTYKQQRMLQILPFPSHALLQDTTTLKMAVHYTGARDY